MLLRHGKSDWGMDIESDHDRILAPRGEKAARLVGRTLTASELVPDRVVTSSAVRARTTAELAVEAGDWSCPMRVTRDLYGTSVAGALDIVRRQDEEPGADRLLLVGHEPTWSGLASGLIGGGRLAVVTACLVVVDLGVDRWADIELGRGELRLLVAPRWLKKVVG